MRASLLLVGLGYLFDPNAVVAQVLEKGKIDGGEFRPEPGTYALVKIAEINGRAVVDLSQLKVKDVEIGLVDGASTLTVIATGNVTFTDRIDGGSRVTVTADGDITINQRLDGPSSLSARCGGTFLVKDKIDGPSRFNVACKKFRVIVKICGPSAGVIDASESVDVPEVCDSVSIEYKNKKR